MGLLGSVISPAPLGTHTFFGAGGKIDCFLVCLFLLKVLSMGAGCCCVLNEFYYARVLLLVRAEHLWLRPRHNTEVIQTSRQ